MLYVHVEQLRSGRDGLLLNRTVPGQAVGGSLPVLSANFSPETNNLLFLNQRKRETVLHERMGRARGSTSGSLSFETVTLPTELPCPVHI